ncbi:FMN-binding protein MioC [Shewanella pneumatophori]|uniref:FMN-binding protein MioC n=1 Tax=Shewanella pneumatophori TaxID=314092 RepID=A0A9X2CJH2_9GAMM|nr:FMN-binding protein MioC [Shewanella pneumatophori]MCL1140765.1 FMN-binding protein MioC [Shewanella pneumatophori]
MAKVEILVGTTLGGTEYVADEISDQLSDLGHETLIHLTPNLDELSKDSLWIIVSSTHGAGDLPDNIVPFFEEIQAQKPDLSAVKYALCAIGDSSYDTFCQGPEKLIGQLDLCSAQVFVDKIQIDVQYNPIAEEAALSWLSEWQAKI